VYGQTADHTYTLLSLVLLPALFARFGKANARPTTGP